MKTNLLKIAGGVLFSLVTLTSASVNGQITAYEHFEYPVGTEYHLVAGSGIGWAGPWDGQKEGASSVGAGYHTIQAGNIEGTIGATGTIGGQWVDSWRDLSTVFPNVVGTDVWIAFTHKNNRPGKGSGATFFWGASENIYLGTLPGDFIGIGNCYQDEACVGTRADAPGIVFTTDAPHYYLAHVTSVASNDRIKIDLWADYNGSTIPAANNTELTWQASGYRNFAGGIDKIRIGGDTEPSEAATLFSTFDAIRINSTFFQRGDVILSIEDEVAKPVSKESNSSFYPNPVTNGELNVVASKESLKSVSIFDLSGKKVASKVVSGQSTKISTQGLAKGVYILEVSGSKSTSRNKLVID